MQYTDAGYRHARSWQIAVFAALLGVAQQAQAQNQVDNPNFATELVPWTLFLSAAPDPAGSGSASWTAQQDVSGTLGHSGAGQVVLDASPQAPHSAAGIRQCIPFAQATTVVQANYGARFKIPATDVADGTTSVAVEVRFFSDAACAQFIAGAGGMQSRSIAASVPDDGFWYSAGDPAFAPPLNTVAGSAEVRASLRKLGTSANAYTAYFDDIYLSLNGSVPVSLQSFGVD
jgi:hypothetical protein